MKVKILNASGTETSQTELPMQFNEPIRTDLIKKAVLAIQNNNRQKYGSMKGAGMRHSAELSRRRRKYRGSYGKGISRIPRKILSRRGTQMYWVGAIVPGTVGGRKGHPPQSQKEWDWKLNTKEKRKAICSAMSAVMAKDVVAKRGHKIPQTYPFIVDDSLEKISKAKEMVTSLTKLGFKDELVRADSTKIRAGKGKLRGRRKTTKKSLLIVVSDASAVRKAANSLPGIDVVNIKRLNAELLAPGAQPGRATLFSTKAIDMLRQGLFTKNFKGETIKKEKKAEEPKKKKVKKIKTDKTKPKVEVKSEIKKPEVKK